MIFQKLIFLTKENFLVVTLDRQIQMCFVVEHTLNGIIGFRVVVDFVITERPLKIRQILNSPKLRLKRQMLQWGQTDYIQKS